MIRVENGQPRRTFDPGYQATATDQFSEPTRPVERDVEAFLTLARERFKESEEATAEIRKQALIDLRFRSGDQWPKNITTTREADDRPCLTINRIPQFLKQVTNEFRQNPLAIQVNPVDNKSDPDTAEVLQGLIRHIEVQSNAQVAYDSASEYAATMGFGYFRVLTDYDNPQSFQKEIYIRRIKNPFTVYYDPKCQEPDYSDGRYAFIVQDYTPEEFKAEYPDSELASLTDFQSTGDHAPGWLEKDKVRVAEYFRVEMEPRPLAQLDDGAIKWVDEVQPLERVLRTRVVQARRVKWAKINAVEILDEENWDGQWIPIIPVLGDELDIDGETQLSGIVRNARDAQRMYNYWTSAETEMIALAPRVPFIGAEGQFENQEDKWKQSNVRNFAYLEYKPKNINGVLVGPPQRQQYEPPVQAISIARMQSAEDLKATTGLYDASLGAVSNEKSGRAILARQQEGDTATFHFSDNRSRAIAACGRILVDLIPHVYNAPRVARIIGPDDSVEMTPVNQPFQKGGIVKIYDLTTGRYDVSVSVGPSYQSKRKEAVASMLDLAKVSPQVAAIGSDLMVRYMDFPGAKELADRLKMALPPQLQGNDEDQPPVPPAVAAHLQQVETQNQQLIAALNASTEKIQSKQQDIEKALMDNASKERIALLEAQVELVKTEATINAQNAQKLMAVEFQAINKRLDMLTVMETKPEPLAAAPQTQLQPQNQNL